MRYLNLGLVVAVLSAAALLVDGLRSGAGLAQPNKPNPIVVAQTVEARKAEANRLLQQGNQQYQTRQYEAALQSWQQALVLYREITDRQGEGNVLSNLGDAYRSLSQHNKALAYYEQAQPIFQQVKDREGEARVLNDLGITYRLLSQYDKAISYYQQALPLLQEIKNRNGEAAALTNLGIAYNSLSQFAKSIEYYEQSLVVNRETKDRKGEANTLRNLGIAYSSLDNYAKSIEYHEQSLAINRETKDRNGQAKALRSLGLAYENLFKYEKAIEYYEQSLAIVREIEDRQGEGRSLRDLGDAYYSLSQYEKAIAYYEQALPIYQQLKDRQGEAGILANLGSTYVFLSQYGRAIAYYQQALPIYQQLKDRNSEASVLMNLGSAYVALYQVEKAITYYEQARPIFQQLKDRKDEAKVLANLGNTYVLLFQYGKAIAYYEQALPIFQQLKDRNSEASVLMNLGSAYRFLSQYKKAVAYFEQALLISQQLKDRNSEAMVLANLGVAYGSLSQFEKAVAYFEQALPISQQIKDPATEGKIFAYLGALFEQRKDPELAIVFYKQSVSVQETIRQDIRRLPRESQEAYTQAVALVYRRLADLLLAQGRVLEAQQVLELLKIQELRDFSRDTRAGGDTNGSPLTPREAPIPPAFSDKIALGQKLTACESQTPRCPERESLQNQLKTANTTFNQLADRLRTQQATKDPAQLQRDELTRAAQKVVLAQPKTVLIYPLVLEDKLWLVWGSQAGSKGVVFDSKEIPVSRKELSATVLRFRQLLERPGDVKELQQVSQKLYGWLIAPIRSQLDANGIQNLVFSLDRATRYIPMAALHDGQHYLVEKFALSTILTSGTTDTSEKLAANPATTKVLGMGLSNAVSGLNPLPSVVDELNGIIRSQPSDRTGIFPGSKFLNQTFDRRAFQDLIDYRILHIATHGKFVSGQPEDSFLVLGNGDPLRIPEIKSMTDLNAIHLVVLSACETAKGGEDKEGLEVSGLSYYFITSGAKAVIASLWLVNDASTSLLIDLLLNKVD